MAEGRELYHLLLKPAGPWLEGRSRLIVETDGPLGLVPFEALVDEVGRFVNESFEIQYSPGLLYNSAFTHDTAVDRRSRALVVGNPLLDSMAALPTLPAAAEEARDIAAQFSKPRLLLGQEAKLSVVLRELAEADVFHFAGHAVANYETTGLLLAGSSEHGGDGVLTALRLNRKLLERSHLIVLSACATVNGAAGSDDHDSLAQNFLLLGAPQVVATRWVVDSTATHEWMKVFYEDRLAGQSSSGSARGASSVVRSQPKWTHPFYWAAFSVLSSTT
jgi:CHAT domain-containing protein